MDYSVKIITFIFLVFLIPSGAPNVLAEGQDIGLRMRSDGANVVLVACSDECPDSPLRIHKGTKNYGVKLVDPGDPLATKMRVQTPGGVMKALKRFMTGRFVWERPTPKFEKTWIATITCKCANGTTATIGQRPDGKGDPDLVTREVRDAIRDKKLTAYITPPAASEPLRRSTGGSGSGSNWVDGTYDTRTLEAVCEILGYDSYVSSTCRDEERTGLYPNGKCNFHTPSNNDMYHFE